MFDNFKESGNFLFFIALLIQFGRKLKGKCLLQIFPKLS